jgi:galactokinase
MGDHTDYLGGWVMPAAVNYYLWVAIARNETTTHRIHSIDIHETLRIKNDRLKPTKIRMFNYPLGVISQIRDLSTGLDVIFGGNIPIGAGMSSSAALCCGMALGLNRILDLGWDRRDMALVAQRSEHEYIGVKCGLMDQYACLFGKESHALLLDCQTLDFELIPVPEGDYEFVLFNSKVNHSLGNSEYNQRRKESESAWSKIQKADPGIKNYRDISPDSIENNTVLSTEERRRARHFISENHRVLNFKEDLKSLDWYKMGEKLMASHHSLQRDYEVTCRETDWIVQSMKKSDSVLGARQMGGGFGGCVLSLVSSSKNAVLNSTALAYQQKFQKKPVIIPVRLDNGCEIIT